MSEAGRQFPTAERVGELLSYDPETGLMRWVVDRRSGPNGCRVNARAGDVAGSLGSSGRYWCVSIDYKNCPVHQLVFLLETGAWPDGEIDHINGDTKDNRRTNLRKVDRQTNSENLRRPMKSSSSGFLGVSRKRSKFHARIISKGKYYHLGSFQTAEEAHAAYVSAKARLHFGSTLGREVPGEAAA